MTQTELRIIAEQTRDQMVAQLPGLGFIMVLLNRDETPTPVVATGNLRSSEAAVRLLRELADKIEREGASPTILVN